MECSGLETTVFLEGKMQVAKKRLPSYSYIVLELHSASELLKFWKNFRRKLLKSVFYLRQVEFTHHCRSNIPRIFVGHANSWAPVGILGHQAAGTGWAATSTRGYQK